MMTTQQRQRRRLIAAGLGLGCWSLARAAPTPRFATEHLHVFRPGLKITLEDYAMPTVALVRDDGRKVSLASQIDDGRPVLVNFIFTTCPGICPIMSQVFSQFQERIGAEREKLHMVSISIDPEQDTPERLRAYAKKFEAGPQWQYYTGTAEASVQAQKAFNAYRGDKMSHDPLTLMRSAPGKPWLRIEGFASPIDLVEQYVGRAALCESKTVLK